MEGADETVKQDQWRSTTGAKEVHTGSPDEDVDFLHVG